MPFGKRLLAHTNVINHLLRRGDAHFFCDDFPDDDGHVVLHSYGNEPVTAAGPGWLWESSTDISPAYYRRTESVRCHLSGSERGTRVPGVVIVAGSGPVNRNGNQAGGNTTNWYSQIADEYEIRARPGNRPRYHWSCGARVLTGTKPLVCKETLGWSCVKWV